METDNPRHSSDGQTGNNQNLTVKTGGDNTGHVFGSQWSNVHDVTFNVTHQDNKKQITQEDKDRMFQDQVRQYRSHILYTEHTHLRTKLNQLNVNGKNCFVKRKFEKILKKTEMTQDGIEEKVEKIELTDEFLINLPRSKASLVSAPSGSGKSTIAASITEQWAKSEDSSYDLVLFLSSLHTAEKSALQRMVWGEYTSTMREESKFIYQVMEERK